ncbi:hypothetical protein FQN54_000093 [Arachnomyces sp. PD_36]|nr:hypothetical protein FQN54_000093 [Arachnomyces sp. PD_36]
MSFASKAEENEAMLAVLTKPATFEGFLIDVEATIPDVSSPTQVVDVTDSDTDGDNHDTAMVIAQGPLDKMSVEILVHIISQLDLKTLMKLRSVNHYLKQIVDHSILPLRQVIKHAPNTLIAIFRTGMASHLTVSDVVEAMYSQTCVICGGFGPALHLLTCKRCCLKCLATHPDFAPLAKIVAKSRYGLDKNTLQNLPVLKTLPGKYSFYKNVYKRRFNLVDERAACDAGIKLHGSREDMELFVGKNMSSTWRDGGSNWSSREHCARRFATATLMPAVNKETKIAELGVRCPSCLHFGVRTTDLAYESYTTKEGLKHVKSCLWARFEWVLHLKEKEAFQEAAKEAAKEIAGAA